MVEYATTPLDLIFQSLADGTRRDILKRLTKAEQTVGELARPYAMSLAAIAKHIGVLERAGLVTKERSGKERVVRIVPATLKAAETHLSEYEKLWAARYDALEALLNNGASAHTNTIASASASKNTNSKRQSWQLSRSRSRKARKT